MSGQCDFIKAAYPTMADDDMMCAQHRHEPRVFALARAMAVAFQKPEPTDEQIAWFLDDADAVVDDFDPTPDQWSVTPMESTREAGLDGTLTINGEPYVVQTSDWEPAHPVKRATYVEWVGAPNVPSVEGAREALAPLLDDRAATTDLPTNPRSDSSSSAQGSRS